MKSVDPENTPILLHRKSFYTNSQQLDVEKLVSVVAVAYQALV